MTADLVRVIFNGTILARIWAIIMTSSLSLILPTQEPILSAQEVDVNWGERNF